MERMWQQAANAQLPDQHAINHPYVLVPSAAIVLFFAEVQRHGAHVAAGCRRCAQRK
jgi:hypothetical protein